MSRFEAVALPLAGLCRVERRMIGDERGFFSRLFCAQELAELGWTKPVAQINHTLTSKRGTVRGLHFQRPPHAEMKWVSCLRGEVWDVVVDVRAGSPTFLHWHAEVLSAANHRSLLIPEGFAHGFQTLTDDVEMLYCHSMPYAADADAGLNPREPRLGVAWPLPVAALSDKDCSRAWLDDSFEGVRL